MDRVTDHAADGLVVSEVFGPTVQGEGPSCGRRAAFVRLGGCNLACSWCDTPYTWDGSRFDLRDELSRRDEEAIAADIERMDVPLVVLTGGEPLLNQRRPAFTELLNLLTGGGHLVEIETNGTVTPSPQIIRLTSQFNVGLKLANSGMTEHRRINAQPLGTFRQLAVERRACFKSVCADEEDVRELADLVYGYDLDPASVWVMPEGVTNEQITSRLALVAQPAVDAGFNVTTRLHIHVWGDQRGH